MADGLAIFFAHPAYLELTEAYDLLQTALADETAAAAAVAPSHPAIESSASKKARSKPVINLQQEVAIIVNKVDAGMMTFQCSLMFFFLNFIFVS